MLKLRFNSGIAKYFLLSSLLALVACVPENVKPNDPEYAPVIPEPTPRVAPKNGSLYQPFQGLSLFGNTSRHRVGDVITVMLDERTVSSKSSGVTIDKESTVDLTENGNQTFFGRGTTVIGNANVPLNASQTREFEGDASADQSNRLEGNISVTITEILPNGNFIVKGEKWLTLNRGDEYIRISGMIRKEDVGLDNLVSSTKLANARISYSGTGDLANSQRMGWLSKFFNSVLWPF